MEITLAWNDKHDPTNERSRFVSCITELLIDVVEKRTCYAYTSIAETGFQLNLQFFYLGTLTCQLSHLVRHNFYFSYLFIIYLFPTSVAQYILHGKKFTAILISKVPLYTPICYVTFCTNNNSFVLCKKKVELNDWFANEVKIASLGPDWSRLIFPGKK